MARKLLEVKDVGDVAVVSFTDTKILDEFIIRALGEQLFGLVTQLGRKKILLNFSNVEFLSCLAIGQFLALNRLVKDIGGQLIMCGLDPQIYEVFDITKLNKRFDIQKNEQSALSAFFI